MSELWSQLCSRASVAIDDSQRALLSRYVDLLLAANERMNLTRITDRAAAEVQHVGDALTALPFLPTGALRVVDVGSGGGVPGIPLAIVRQDASFLLIESTKKKAAFLRDTVQSLGLSSVSVTDSRAEDVGQSNETRDTFDVCISRAVATIDWLAEWCLPLVCKGGKMLAMKGPKVIEELPVASKAIRVCGGGEPVVHPIELPETIGHVIVEIPKIGKSDSRFPRRATEAKKNPIR